MSGQETKAKAPTLAQLRALRAIAAGQVRRYWPWDGSPSHWEGPRDVRADVITRCVDARWARVGPMMSQVSAPVVLTEEGERALDEVLC